MSAEERKNRKVGIWTSAGVHAALLLALFFIVAWRAPDPPLPEYGIELNFGLDNQGSGDIQPEQEVGDQGESATTGAVPEAATQETEDSQKDAPSKAEEPTTSKAESPLTVKEVTKPAVTTKETAKPESSKAKTEPTVTPPTETPKESQTAESTKKGDAPGQGDDKAKTGDKGSEEGKLDAKALYGTPGGGGGGTGMNLQMSGWTWAEQPTIPQLPDNENGRIVFEIECDENGDITGITTVERTLSPRAEQLLKDMIRKNSLMRTSGGRAPERSKGSIVFVLRTR